MDPRVQTISFHTSMPQAVERLVGGLMSHDWEGLGLHFLCTNYDNGAKRCVDGDVRLLDLTEKTLPALPKDGMVLFPNIGYEQQSWSSIFVAAYTRRGRDMALNNKARIWIEGVDGEPGKYGFPDPQDQIRFHNPMSGFTYVARRYGTEDVRRMDANGGMTDVKTIEKGIGARMLVYANWLVSTIYRVERTASGPTFDEYGSVVYMDETPKELESATPSNRTRFNRYVGIIDGARQVGKMFGGGPF